MNKWVKGTSLALAAVAVLAGATVLVGKAMGERKMQRVISVPSTQLLVPAARASLEQGRYLFATRGCADCHTASGGGKEVINSGAMLVISPNITRGANSATATYVGTDWVRTLRHGVKPDGRPVMIMPSEDYNRLSNDDVASIIAYVQQLPPVPGRRATVQLPVAVKVLYAFGYVKDAAELIDHVLPPQPPVLAAVSLAHGAYVANSCVGCHGATLSGGKIPGAPPEWPAPANLTTGNGSAMKRYPTPELFMTMLRSGKRPDGSAISSVMPFGSLREMNDVDVRALHSYLQTLPQRAAGGR
ncbi:c-type cytochrome [Massilia sp. TSP1-1-2]|uniref:c-type cytochrome n=1 Tax=Massilia sp. TSP1-1-2 TaxID=2804649 RepID=UPI003CFAC96C